ncbi:MAG: dTDP-4-dehydrorhamnose reductase [Anaerolineae bacterium]
MKVAVIGSMGQLGTDLVRSFSEAGQEVIPLPHAEMEVTDQDSVRKILLHHRPQAVVNCAAYVRVDQAEGEPEAAFRVNALGALYVARACAELNALCLYISTDYVFEGDKDEPYNEEDTPRPINVYGASKLAGEHLVRLACPQSLIVRVGCLFGKAGASGKGGNFIETILARTRASERLKIVSDIRISPTYTSDAAPVLVKLTVMRTTGIVHVTNSGSCTWYALAKRAVELSSLNIPIEPVSSSSYPRPASRPRNSALDGTRAAKLVGDTFRPWEEALESYLKEKGYLRCHDEGA